MDAAVRRQALQIQCEFAAAGRAVRQELQANLARSRCYQEAVGEVRGHRIVVAPQQDAQQRERALADGGGLRGERVEGRERRSRRRQVGP